MDIQARSSVVEHHLDMVGAPRKINHLRTFERLKTALWDTHRSTFVEQQLGPST